MRNFVIALFLAIAPLLACGAAYAKASGDIGKPICSHFDDSTKPAPRAPADANADTAAAAAVASAPASTATATSPMSAGKGATSSPSGMAHTRPAPRWQTFLPGMFR